MDAVNEQLYEFYQDYLNWVKKGAVEKIDDMSVYQRGDGLCKAFARYAYRNEFRPILEDRLLKTMLLKFKRLGLPRVIPFNKNWLDFQNESDERRCHLNPQRIQFVENRVKEFEALRETP